MGQSNDLAKLGHSDFPGNKPLGPFDYTKEDHDEKTSPFNPKSTWRHFRSLDDSEKDLTESVKTCNFDDFERYAHQMQDFFSHYDQGFRADRYNHTASEAIRAIITIAPNHNFISNYEDATIILDYPTGHLWASIFSVLPEVPEPDNAKYYKDAYYQAKERSDMWYTIWNNCCCQINNKWEERLDIQRKPKCINLKQPHNSYGEKAAPPSMNRPIPEYESEGTKEYKKSPIYTKTFGNPFL